MGRLILEYGTERTLRKRVMGYFQELELRRICRAALRKTDTVVDINKVLRQRGSGSRLHTYNDLEAGGYIRVRRTAQGLIATPTALGWRVYRHQEPITVAHKPASGYRKVQRSQRKPTPLQRAYKRAA